MNTNHELSNETNHIYKYNYLTLLDTYYSRGIQKLFGTAHPIFLALLHKANELKWKEKFSMSNEELAYLAAVTTITVIRSRSKLTSVRIDRKKLVRIVEGGYNQAPEYKISYELLNGRSVYQNDRQSLSRDYQNDTRKNQSQQASSESASEGVYQNDTRTSRSAYQNDTIPNSNRVIYNKESKREFDSIDGRLLENGMTWGAFRQLLEFKVGVIKIGTEDNDKFRQALEREPEEKLIEAVEYVKNLENQPMIRYILERIHGYIDQWDYHQGQKQQAPLTAQQQLDKAHQELEHFTGDPRYEKSASEQYAINYVKTVKGEIARLEREVKNAE